MKQNFIYFTLALFAISCSSNPKTTKKKGEIETIADSVISEASKESKSIKIEAEQKEMKLEKFYSFFNNFMWDLNLQKERVDFPVKIDSSIIETADKWTFLPFYSGSDFMINLSKDTIDSFIETNKQDSVLLCIVNFQNEKVEKYLFKVNNLKWYLSSKQTDSLLINEDFGFLEFLIQFSQDSMFQMKSIDFPLQYQTFDYDNNYETVNKKLEQTDWKYLCLTKDLENLFYLDNQSNHGNYRTLYYKGIENGIRVDFVFEKQNESWKLIKWSDLST